MDTELKPVLNNISDSSNVNSSSNDEVNVDSSAVHKIINDDNYSSTLENLDASKMFASLISSLDNLREAIQELVDTKDSKEKLSPEADDQFFLRKHYFSIHKRALTSFSLLHDVEKKVELSTFMKKREKKNNSHFDEERNEDSNEYVLSHEKRETMHIIGKELWMLIRNYPEYFIDHTSSYNFDNRNVKQHDNENERKLNEYRLLCTVASGFVRGIASRLILIDYIQTKCKSIPVMKFVSENGNSTPSTNDEGKNKASENLKKSITSSYTNPSGRELEFGLKCFARSGRAILFYVVSSNQDIHHFHNYAAYANLSLAVNCYETIKKCSSAEQSGMETEENKNLKMLIQKNCEEGFDALVLLPDAASLYIPKKNGSDTTNNVVQLLHDAENFVGNFSSSNDNNTKNEKLSCSVIDRFLPCLARVSYKHGNRFARLGNFSDAKSCLRITLQATDQCIASIRSSYKNEKNGYNETKLIQEQEMLLVSKEAFYVLCHVCQEMGEYVKAQQCLDRIETYIEDQKQRDEEQYVNIMERIKKSDSSSDMEKSATSPASSFEVNKSDLAFVRSKNQDKVEIIARAQTARAKARIMEMKERANLAFTKIMICERSAEEKTREEDLNIDEHVKTLLEFCHKLIGNEINEEHENPYDNEYLKLLLRATRCIYVRRLCSSEPDTYVEKINFRNPYKFLHTRFSFDLNAKFYSVKHLCISVDQISVTLAVIQKLRKKNQYAADKSEFTNKLLILDSQCIQDTKTFYASIERIMQPHNLSSNENEVSILSKVPFKQLFWLLKECYAHCARAVSMYMDSDDNNYECCAKWCDCLLTCLTYTDKIKSHHPNIETVDFIDDHERKNQALSEVLAIKAYALTKTGQIMEGLQCARKSWDTNKTNPQVKNLVTLFYCSAMYETKSEKNESYESLLELDEAISHILLTASSSDSNVSHKKTGEIISIFSTLTSSCMEIESDDYKPILLGLQERWTEALIRSSTLKNSLSSDIDSKSDGNLSLFCVLRAYLCNFENVLNKLSVIEDSPKVDRIRQNLDRILDSILELLCNIRDGDKNNKHGNTRKRLKIRHALDETKLENTSGSGDLKNDGKPSSLLWEDDDVSTLIGNYHDFVWVAEQLWNLAINLMSNETRGNKYFSAQLFAKAHDFALLSEEESCLKLSRGYLDHDQQDSFDAQKNAKKEDDFCDLSSEFSAQCLLLSVAATVDDLHHTLSTSTSDLNSYSKMHFSHLQHCMKRCLRRIYMAKAEFSLNLEENQDRQKEYIESLIAWLTLRCQVELGDDDACLEFLSDNFNINQLKKSVFSFGDTTLQNKSEELDCSEKQKLIRSTSLNEEPCTISHLFLCSKRAETSQMIRTVKFLLTFCANQMKEKGENRISIDRNQYSIGDIQRKLIQIASSVSEVKIVFEDINNSLGNISKDGQNLTSTNKKNQLYTTEEFDWFCVEAYNRGVNLIFLGDSESARRFICIALNLLPFCGREVESYGTEMRLAYQGAIECKRKASWPTSASTGNILGLFDYHEV